MKTIEVPASEQVSEPSQLIFDHLKKRLGKVPNLYATIGYSEHALKAFVDFETELGHGVFNGKQREAIALIVSEVNGCAYCLAGHTLAAMKNGFSKEDTLNIRRGIVDDPKLSAIIKLAKSVVVNKGYADAQAMEDFYAAGFTESGLMELVGLLPLEYLPIMFSH